MHKQCTDKNCSSSIFIGRMTFLMLNQQIKPFTKIKQNSSYHRTLVFTEVNLFRVISHCTTTSTSQSFISGMQLLWLRSAICRHHPPHRAVLSQICCFGERKMVLFQCWTVLSHVMRGRPSCLLQSARGEANRIRLASALHHIYGT